MPSNQPNPSLPDLEIKDPVLIFNSVWAAVESEIGRENLRLPRELILLGGAPGSGKGTNTRFIMDARGLTAPPVVVSDLLDSPEARAIKDRGELVGDREVMSLVLRKLLEPRYQDGAILDGFPRTQVQVECMKLLVQKLRELHGEYRDTPLAQHFRRPTIHVVVLFVTEETSVARQLARGDEARKHNQKVAETGEGELVELRATDTSAHAAQVRYRRFKEKTWAALQSLKEVYHYHFVNAEAPIEEVEARILEELRYQSSLELEPATFDRLKAIQLASDIIVHARQQLVERLDGYERETPDLFQEVVDLVQRRFMPIIERHAMSGHAVVNVEDPLLNNERALGMLIDVFAERGYQAVVDKRLDDIPVRFDLKTGEIEMRRKIVYRTQIRFRGSQIQRG